MWLLYGWNFKYCVFIIVLLSINFARANNSLVETGKYLVNKNYIILVLINIKNFYYYCLMLNNFFTVQQIISNAQIRIKNFLALINRKRTSTSTVLPQAKVKGITWNVLEFLGLSVGKHCKLIALDHFVKKKDFWEGIGYSR